MKNILSSFSELFSAKYCNRVVLEDKTVNDVKDIVQINGTEYVYLKSIKNEYDFCIRKFIVENGKLFICGLDNNIEFDMVIKRFAERDKNLNIYLNSITEDSDDNNLHVQITLDEIMNLTL